MGYVEAHVTGLGCWGFRAVFSGARGTAAKECEIVSAKGETSSNAFETLIIVVEGIYWLRANATKSRITGHCHRVL